MGEKKTMRTGYTLKMVCHREKAKEMMCKLRGIKAKVILKIGRLLVACFYSDGKLQ